MEFALGNALASNDNNSNRDNCGYINSNYSICIKGMVNYLWCFVQGSSSSLVFSEYVVMIKCPFP